MFHANEIQIITCIIGAIGLLSTLAVYSNASYLMRRYVSRF